MLTALQAAAKPATSTDANIMSVAPSTARFSYLPISMPSLATSGEHKIVISACLLVAVQVQSSVSCCGSSTSVQLLLTAGRLHNLCLPLNPSTCLSAQMRPAKRLFKASYSRVGVLMLISAADSC